MAGQDSEIHKFCVDAYCICGLHATNKAASRLAKFAIGHHLRAGHPHWLETPRRERCTEQKRGFLSDEFWHDAVFRSDDGKVM